MDAAQWPQQVAGFSRPMEEIPIPLPNNNSNNNPTSLNNNNNPSKASPTPLVGGDQRKTRPQKDQNINCPRCNSTNTKFCYYNNYSLTQPRYFCKTCRRYWTHGGSLRNVPVGGGSRKNKRSSSSTPSNPSQGSISTVTNPSTIPTKLIPDLNPPSSLSHLITSSQNPKFLEGQDLNLAFPIQGIFQTTNNENHEPINIMNVNNNSGNTNLSSSTNTNTCSTTTSNTPISALELLRTGIASRGSLNPYVPIPMSMPMPVPVPDSSTLYPSGFPNMQDFKPNMNLFSPQSDHSNMVGSGENNVVGSGARLLFPFADMNKLATTTTTNGDHQQHHNEIDHDQSKGGNDHHQQQHHHHHHHQGHNNATTGYWSGMLGGGTW